MASFSVPCPKTSALVAPNPSPTRNPNLRNTSVALFHKDLKSNRASVSGSSSPRLQATKRNQNGVMKVSAQLNEIDQGESSNSAPPLENSSKISSSKTAIPDVASITAFMNQVAGLVELVDSRDIMELQIKQDDCEVLIRKKEALPPPPAPPMVMMQSSQPQPMFHSQPPPPQAAPTSPAPAPAPSASAPTLPAPAKPKSSLPPLKCPMAGTFYRAPAPGAPPFVKVGDKVQKGQVVCIIEAMKLMNEIEADQSGTIVDIIAEDGKPVSLDTPLLVIEP